MGQKRDKKKLRAKKAGKSKRVTKAAVKRAVARRAPAHVESESTIELQETSSVTELTDALGAPIADPDGAEAGETSDDATEDETSDDATEDA